MAVHAPPCIIAAMTTGDREHPQLVRGLGLWGATALSMVDMIGVGPFITIPVILAAMGGPQAMLGWVAGAVLAICDGLVWAELGAAMPRAGGSYFYLEQIYGERRLGRLFAFLFVFQLIFSAPVSMATGCIGLGQYAAFFHAGLLRPLWQFDLRLRFFGAVHVPLEISGSTVVAMIACLVVIVLVYRRISAIDKLAKTLWVVVMLTMGWVILAALTHFHPSVAFDFPAGAFHLSKPFFLGLGAALITATYDYWGYYNVCFLGEEVKDPGRNIPRALLLSIVLVAAMYLVMNVGILGVVPWREVLASKGTQAYVAAEFMQRVYGAHWAGAAVAVLVMWTALASVFSLMAGYSRIPYAAARDGNFFRALDHLHPRGQFPDRSVLLMGALCLCFCLLRLQELIAALVVLRVTLQFLLQAIGVIVLRARRPDLPRPFRMWLYPLPALIAIAGFVGVLASKHQLFARALVFALIGVAIYLLMAARRRQWPFVSPQKS
jgi:amino acid transporter